MTLLSNAAVHAVFVLTAALPQTQSAPAMGVGPTDAVAGHYHEGELGEKLLYLEQRLKCNCSCGLDVHSCQFQMQCGTSPVWSQRIRDGLRAGESVEAIEAGFVAEFGMTVLMAPPPEGFNLLGYLLPGAAILTAGMLVGLLVRRGTGVEARPVPIRETTEEDEARLRAALKDLDRSESPDW